MKNTKMVMVLILCMTFFFVFSCASSGEGGSGLGPGVLATGEWMVYNDENDKGDSSAELAILEEERNGEKVTVYHVKGNVTTKFQYGFAGWGINSDEETLERLKTCKAVSFWIEGDGQTYSIKFKTSNITDYGYFEYRFNTEKGVPLLIEVPVGFFMQPSWAATARRNLGLCTGVEWQTHESWRRDPRVNPFEIKTWGFKIHQ